VLREIIEIRRAARPVVAEIRNGESGADCGSSLMRMR
jgi:hypothetical protein